ncbi:DUF3177 family protein [Leptolyngbya sp. FACHB-36]|uniref:DUF3177 family protein n=1 Tax=Leptolyngbya sp. FACHB-36 TaxID=2692808 RepID=UPI00168127C2|nr:DUF3177 family protein [Leptolyngbya sp. FACHB-36]MBD2019784.1 DUF3177 family protein [Leptolyngbya sp. FACHB-36]
MPTPSWLPSIVWTDYRLALLFTVLIPLALLVWAFVQKFEAVQTLLTIYWRVASLLAITVYLLIGALPIGFLSGWLAGILIPLSLWFWIDLNEEIADQPPNQLKLAFTSWRWAVSVYCVVGAIAQIPTLRCALLPAEAVVKDSMCSVWLAPPWAFREFFHAGTRPYFLGFLGLVGLAVYVLYFSYFVLMRLNKQGRSATGQ